MQTTPSTNIPSANTTPPSITRNSATAIAGIAASTRAPRSEPGSRRLPLRLPRLRDGGRRPALRRSGRVAGGDCAARAPPGVCGPLDISSRSSPTEPASALGVLRERLLERLAREVRPQLLAEHQLRVRGLPQQVVGQAPLAARADDQVGVVHLRRVQACAELLFIRVKSEGPGLSACGRLRH